MSNHNSCNKCHKQKCACIKIPEVCYSDGCDPKMDAACVFYKINGGVSYLQNFFGVGTKTSLEEILEKAEHKLGNAFTIQLTSCAAAMFNIATPEVDYKVYLAKLTEYLCNKSDQYVRVSPTDTLPGYLNDKVIVGECIRKVIIRDSNGVEQVKIELDFDCIQSKNSGSTCIEVDCCGSGGTPPISPSLQIATNTPTVCGSNVATLTVTSVSPCSNVDWFRNNVYVGSTTGSTYQVNQSGNYFAICKSASGANISLSQLITITHTGNCSCVDTIWTDTGVYRCVDNVSKKEQVSNCGTFRDVNGGSACDTCIPVWVVDPDNAVFCGNYLNEEYNTNIFEDCVLYQRMVNQCNSDKSWEYYFGSPDPEINCCPCVPNGNDTCSSAGNKITFRDSCDEVIGEITLNTTVASCSGTTRVLTASVTAGSGTTLSDYTIEYSLSGATTRPFQSSGVFSGVALGSHTVTVKVSKAGAAAPCTLTNSVNSITCDGGGGCTDPIGSIVITSNATSVCPDTAINFSAIQSNCDNIQWFATPSGGSATQIGTGTSVNYTPTGAATVHAVCSNCNPGSVTSNSINVEVVSCEDIYYILKSCEDGSTVYTKDAPPTGVPNSTAENFDGDLFYYDGHTISPTPLPYIEVTAVEGTFCPGAPCEDPIPSITLSVAEGDSTELCPDNSSVVINMTSNYCGSATFFFTPDGGGSPQPLGTGSSMTVTQTTPGYITASCMSCAGTGTSNSIHITYSNSCGEECTDPTPSITEFSSNRTELETLQSVTFTAVGSDCTQFQFLRAELGSEVYTQMQNGASNTYTTTFTGKYKVKCTNCQGTSNESSVITVIEKPLVRYYKIRSCEDGQDYYTTTNLGAVPSGKRLTIGMGVDSLFTNLNHADDMYDPPMNLVGEVSITALDGCPVINTFYQLMACEDNELFYTDFDMSSYPTSERVVINGDFTAVYTGTVVQQEGTPPNLVSNVSPQGVLHCPGEVPIGETYYSIMICDTEEEGYVSIDLSEAEEFQRLTVGPESVTAIYTGSSIQSETEPSPYYSNVSVITGQTGCPE